MISDVVSHKICPIRVATDHMLKLSHACQETVGEDDLARVVTDGYRDVSEMATLS